MATRLAAPARRQQILRVAIEVFSRNGFRGTTTKSIAAAARVSEATLFLHFPTKRQLYHAILEEKCWAGGVRPGEIRALGNQPLPEALAAVVRTIVRRHHRDGTLLRLLLYSALENEPLAPMVMQRHLQGPFRELVDLLQAAYPAVRGRKLEVAARAFVGMVLYEVLTRDLLREDGGGIPALNQLSAAYAKILLSGLTDLAEESA